VPDVVMLWPFYLLHTMPVPAAMHGQPGEAKGNAVCHFMPCLFCRGPGLMLDMSARASELRFLSDTGEDLQGPAGSSTQIPVPATAEPPHQFCILPASFVHAAGSAHMA